MILWWHHYWGCTKIPFREKCRWTSPESLDHILDFFIKPDYMGRVYVLAVSYQVVIKFMDAPCTTCNVWLHGQGVCITIMYRSRVYKYKVSWCSIYHMQCMIIWPGCIYYYYVLWQGIYISCEVSGMWMLHVSHARYDNMGRVYVLAVSYQVCGCPMYSTCKVWLHNQGVWIITTYIGRMYVLAVRYQVLKLNQIE